ncbi:dermonecrotic toxin domain-containing protein [Pseudomonas sp. Irchel 3F5]|uniref:dermonecrotic toxin domain-containing protein n=1 Tax=Pseudomonas sp. Irchel 3F5 TaxID=2009002 RepID=UPI001595AD0D|nr:DUF6543 domain-containing protein [Pseudomonas sp. Irchel 3F5]
MTDSQDVTSFHQNRLHAALKPRLRHLDRNNLHALLHSQRAIHVDSSAQAKPWFNDASQAAQSALLSAVSSQQRARWALAQSLSTLKSITDFAAPLLTQALHEQHGLQLDVRNARLHRWASETIGSRQVIKGPGRETSLLEAALQNFEANEDFHFSFLTREGDETAKLELKGEDFASLCRTLDLGQRYQEHLQQVYDSAVGKALLGEQMAAANRTDFQVLLQRARMKSEISEPVWQMLQTLATQGRAMLDDKPVVCRRIAILGCELSDVLLIGPDPDSSNRTERCVAWIAGAPLYPLKQYNSTSDFAKDLAISLQSPGYSRAIAAKVPQALKAEFIQRLQNTLFEVRYQGNTEVRQPLAQPRLDVVERVLTGALWDTLQDLQVRRLKANARVLAVPTGDENYAARLQRLDSWLGIAVNVLNAAAFVIPGLNEVMLAVAGAQMMGDLFDGVQAWEARETAQALAHLESLGLNLGLVVGLGAAGVALHPSAFVDSLSRVELANGQRRLWKPDLSGYASKVEIPATTQANQLGQYLHEGQHYLRLDERWYQQRFDTQQQRWRLVHPEDAQAHQPLLEHNGQGTWSFEGEQPLNWPRRQLLRRIGVLAEGLDDAMLERAASISACDEQVLRHMYVHHEPVPALLADTLRRMQLERDITRMCADIRGATPLQPGMTYPVALIVQLPRWPANRVLQVFAGPELWGASTTYGLERWPQGRVLKLLASDVRQGQLPQRVLAQLDEGEITAWLGDGVASSDRLQRVRDTLAEQAQSRRHDILDSLQASEAGEPSSGGRRLLASNPSLPPRLAEEIVSEASATELAELERADGRVPLRLAEEVRAYQQQLRLSRAIEGTHWRSMGNPDSERLALGLLESLPGWSGNVRVELRENALSGRLLASAGPANGELKTVVSTAGRYRGYDATGNELYAGADYFAALLKALPDAERRSLGIDVFDDQTLQEHIQQLALGDRQRVSRLLGQQPRKPWHRSPLRLADGRNGYPLGGAVGTLRGEAFGRLGRLYPGLNQRQIAQLVSELRQTGRDLAQSIEALEKEFSQLKVKLDYWARPASRSASRRVVAMRLKKAWQRAGGTDSHVLNLKDMDLTDLPALDVEFKHITELDLRSVHEGAIPPQLLRCFPRLKAVGVGGNQLEAIPEGLAHCTELQELALGHNRLVPSQALFEPLKNLRQLRILSMPQNRLNALPDAALEALAGVRSLVYLDLRANDLVLDAQQLRRLSRLQLSTLKLSANHLTLDEAGAAAFADFIYLKTLDLSWNPLMRAPDFSFMPWLKDVNLEFCQLTEWPDSLTTLMNQQQYQLRTINLADNGITQIPSLASTRFGLDLRRGGPGVGLTLRLANNPLEAQGILRLHALGLAHVFHGPAQTNLWLADADQGRQELWEDLFANEQNRALRIALNTLERSQAAQIDQVHLGQRVWRLLERAAEDNGLRSNLDTIAEGFPETCGDAGADVFSALEVEVMSYGLASRAVHEQGAVAELAGLYKRLYRRHEVERIADRITAARLRRQDARGDEEPLLRPALDPLDDISDADLEHDVDDIEIRLALRRALAQRLDFPEPSDGMLYQHLAYVSERLVGRVEREVHQAESAARRQQWLVEQPNWIRFLKEREQGQFSQLSEDWYEGLAYADYCVESSDEAVTKLDDSVVTYLAGQAQEEPFLSAGITPLAKDPAGKLLKKKLTGQQHKVFYDAVNRGKAAAERALLASLTAALD